MVEAAPRLGVAKNRLKAYAAGICQGPRMCDKVAEEESLDLLLLAKANKNKNIKSAAQRFIVERESCCSRDVPRVSTLSQGGGGGAARVLPLGTRRA